jgi:hypothetical protein
MIREHEMRHVDVYRESLRDIVKRAQRELPAIYGAGVLYAQNGQASQQAIRERMQEFMQGFIRARSEEIKARQAEIDTPEEYARLSRACAKSVS